MEIPWILTYIDLESYPGHGQGCSCGCWQRYDDNPENMNDQELGEWLFSSEEDEIGEYIRESLMVEIKTVNVGTLFNFTNVLHWDADNLCEAFYHNK